VEVPTQYARSGDLHIAFQVLGGGPIDVVIIPAFMSNIEIGWELPDWARFLGRLSSFARLIVFDRRGNGMSDGVAGGTPLEEQIDDVHAVLDAVGSEQPALISTAEGCALATLFAASHPERVRALVLLAPLPRLVQGAGYEWGQTVEERDAVVQTIIEHWGSSSLEQPWSVFAGEDEQLRRGLARYQRLSMGPTAAAASLATAGQVDVRGVLPSVQCPTLVLRRARDTLIDARHSRYVADRIPHAQYAEVPGTGSVWGGEDDAGIEKIEQFLTGTRRPVASDRVLATVMFTDIVGSTERVADVGDGAWRLLLERYDALVREQVELQRGRVVKSLGDGTLAVFDGPSRAISCAIAIRDGARGLDVQVRGGLHAGECELLADGDVGGLAVHIAARISSHAQPGEVLVSSTVRDLVVGSGRALADRGEQRLKGVPGAWRVFAVEA
jgi:class 3 adenylate cyclase